MGKNKKNKTKKKPHSEKDTRDKLFTNLTELVESVEGRISWDDTCMLITVILAGRVTCIYHKIGCVFLGRDKRLLAMGYNGPPTGFPHCIDVGCAKDKGRSCIGAHAEQNVIVFASGPPRETFKGSTLYITSSPCNQCMKSLANLGVARIVFRKWYQRREIKEKGVVETPDKGFLQIAELAGIRVEKWSPKTGETKVILKGRKKE